MASDQTKRANFQYTRAWRHLLAGLECYCEAHKIRFEEVVGNDYYIGSEGIVPIMDALFAMLSGETGNFKAEDLAARLKIIRSENNLQTERHRD